MDDLISRADALNTILFSCNQEITKFKTMRHALGNVGRAAFDSVKALPAVDAAPQWISVEDRLPEIDQEVLIRTNEGLYDIAQFTGADRFWTLERNPSAWVTATGVTHWMPLPEPPKEVT